MAGVSLLAALALVALPANARADQLNAGEYPASLSSTAVGQPQFVFNALGTSCSTNTIEGSIAGAASTVTLHPAFSGCTAFGLGATITTTGCDFVSHIGLALKLGPFEFTWPSPTDIACSGTNVIKIVAGTCEVQVGSQTELKPVHWVNWGGSPAKVRFELDVQNLAYNVTKDGFLCPLSGTGKFTLGEINGNYVVAGAIEEEAVGLWIE